MPDIHAQISPSAAHRWLRCAGALALESTQPDKSSIHADEGTRAHALAEQLLNARLAGVPVADSDADPEMLDYVLRYVDTVWSLADGNELMIEQRVDFSDVIGVENSFGTADAIIIAGSELQIHDLKYGRGVRVDAEQNEQLQLYALGALEEFGLLYEFDTVRLFIHQPRLGHTSEWALSVDDLNVFGERAQEAAAAAMINVNIALCDGVESLPASEFTPGEKQCRFCKAASVCAARAQHHLNTVAADFVDLTQPVGDQLADAAYRIPLLTPEQLADLYAQADFIDSWLKAVRDRVNSELNAGHAIPGFKLVEGKAGNRAWRDANDAEEALKAMRLKKDEMYDFKLITPTKAEKLLKKESPRRWKKLEGLIHRPDGKPTIAPESDPRPALSINPADDFDDVSDDALAADLI